MVSLAYACNFVDSLTKVAVGVGVSKGKLRNKSHDAKDARINTRQCILSLKAASNRTRIYQEKVEDLKSMHKYYGQSRRHVL
jgi:hypothetical protein